jgi:dethiobiotin synthetase
MKKLFVTGTDTAVGKTIASLALLQSFAQQGLSTVGYKPVACGGQNTAEGLINKDAQILQSASTVALPYLAINPQLSAQEEIAMLPADVMLHPQLTQGLIHLSQQADRVVVEGYGGWRSVITGSPPLSSWVAEQQLAVILVVGIKAGCVSHALLSVESILHDGLKLAGWVANRINPGLAHYADIISLLRQNIAAPLLGEIPYLPRAEQRDLTGWIDITSPVQILHGNETK